MKVCEHYSFEEEFLDHATHDRLEVTLFLVNGVKLQGIITGHDGRTLVLRRERSAQLVFKSAISTILPLGAVALFSFEN